MLANGVSALVSRSIVTSLLVLASVVLSDEAGSPRAGSTQPLVAPGAPVGGELAPNRSRSHFLELKAGQYVHLTVEPQGPPIVATMLDPARTLVVETRDPDSGDAPLHLSVLVTRSGVHELKLEVPGATARSAAYRLTLDPPRPATPRDRLRVQAAQASADAARSSSEQTADATQKAMKRYEEARAISHRIGDAREEAEALAAIGGLQLHQGAPRAALPAVQDAVALYQAAGDRRGEATSLNALGVVTWSLGDSTGALAYYDRALPIAHDLALVSLEGSILSNIGSVHKNQGDARKALSFYERSLPLRRQAGDLGGESTSLSNIGVAHRMLGDRGRALAAYEAAVVLARRANHVEAEGVALQNLGALSLSVADLERGEEVLEAARALSRRTGDRRGEAFVLGWLSVAQRLRGNHAEAVALITQELTLRRVIGDRHGEAAALTYLGTLHRLRGETAAAEANLTDGLRLERAVGDRAEETHALLELAGLRQDTGDLAAADEILSEALTASRSVGDPGAEATALLHTAQLRRQQGRLGDARRAAEGAIALLESLRSRVQGARSRTSFFVSAQDAYELLIDVLMTMDSARPGRGLAQLALEASEHKRARTLLDLLTSSGVSSAAAPQADPAPTLDAHHLLDDRTVVLEYSLGDRASYAWAITRGGTHSARLAPKAAILAAARAFHDSLATPPSQPAGDADARARRSAAAATELTRLVIAPLAEHIDRERVAIVADGGLQYVPFAALPEPMPERGQRGAIAAPPLVVHHEIVFLPSVTALERLRERVPPRKTPRPSVAVLADPVFEADDPRVERGVRALEVPAPAALPRGDLLRAARDVGLEAGPGFPRLPYSREEAEAILETAPPGSALRAVDFDASRATALSGRLADYDIVHFATHGFVDDARPDLSGLVLSLVDRTGQPQDGFLRLRDLHALRLPVELVVLSGCRTGLGKEVRGEGMLGIVRAFMHAGARRVVASLWDIDDRATAVFMKAFYEQMLTSGRSAPAALREAQLALRARERWADPFYWAPFVVHGEWN